MLELGVHGLQMVHVALLAYSGSMLNAKRPGIGVNRARAFLLVSFVAEFRGTGAVCAHIPGPLPRSTPMLRSGRRIRPVDGEAPARSDGLSVSVSLQSRGWGVSLATAQSADIRFTDRAITPLSRGRSPDL